MKSKHPIRVYFCGGTGYNLGHLFSKVVETTPMLKASVSIAFLDASTANNREGNNDTNTLVVGTGRGSGKVRAENAKDIRASVPEIVHKFQPGTFNLLVGCASGGSGSTIVNELARYFMSKDIPCVSLLAGSLSSRAEIENTYKTFSSFSLAAEKFERPALVYFRQNDREKPRDHNNEKIISSLTLLCLLLSGQDDKADESDFKNFLNYPQVTPYPPALAGIELFLDHLKPAKHETVYSLATVARQGHSTDVMPPPQYQTAGYLSDEDAKILGSVNVLHWAVLGNSFTELMKNLSAQVEEFARSAAAHRVERFGPTNRRKQDDDLVV